MKPEVFLPEDYRPAEDEPFMNDRQLEYFRRKLIVWKQELLGQSAETIDNLLEALARPEARLPGIIVLPDLPSPTNEGVSLWD